jgi:hypothetical protein
MLTIGRQRAFGPGLFTDIVGSTERATRLGDRAWRQVLERHHVSTVRRVLTGFQNLFSQLRRLGGAP